ncbi:MAG: hypothetical protein NVS1B1_01270 [Candidatus Limnocylindrales bacterium]
MLARLSGIAGIGAAEVDHRGELLRLRLDDTGALGSVHAALEELGYGADAVTEGASGGEARWYGAETVRQLSREESVVIARRITPPFEHAGGLDQGGGERLTSAVAEALYGCFTTHALGAGAPSGEMREACATAVEVATTPLIGAARARKLAEAIRQALQVIEESR